MSKLTNSVDDEPKNASITEGYLYDLAVKEEWDIFLQELRAYMAQNNKPNKNSVISAQPKTEDWLDDPLVDSVELLWLTHSMSEHERHCLEKSLHKLIRSHTLDKQEVERAIGPDERGEKIHVACPDGNMGCAVYHTEARITPAAKARNDLRQELRQALKLTKGQE